MHKLGDHSRQKRQRNSVLSADGSTFERPFSAEANYLMALPNQILHYNGGGKRSSTANNNGQL